MTKILMWVNLVLTFVWMVLIFPTMFWWKDSILWVAMMSIWANVASHFAGFIAGRTEVQAQRGHNLTEADRKWILQQLILIANSNMSTSPLHASMSIMSIAKTTSIQHRKNLRSRRAASFVTRRASVRAIK